VTKTPRLDHGRPESAPNAAVDDLTASTTTFDCLAVNEELDDGRASGYGFDATMNWDDGSYTWQLQT
jgi:hypothetical protein